MKTFTCLIVTIAVLLSGLLLACDLHVYSVQAYETAKGVISVDTTWTKANSPYNLTGNVLVDTAATLTIQPGVIVNLNDCYLQVNGMLTASGTSSDKIHFNGEADSYIRFMASSNGWNPDTGTGSTISNAIVNTKLDIDSSILVHDNTITKRIIIGDNGSPVISKNNIAVTNPFTDTNGRPLDPFGSAIGVSIQSSALIVDNYISGSFTQATVVIGGSPTLERNEISNSYGYGGDSGYGQSGILITENGRPIIKQNTITKCANGISIDSSPIPTITNNNIESITNFNLHMGSGIVDVDAANNWWGTTDTAVIDQKIYDYNDDFNLGKVNYTPFLTSANPKAMPDPNAPIPTPNTPQTDTPSPDTTTTSPILPSQNPTASPDSYSTQTGVFGLDWVQFATLGLFAVVVVLLLVVVVFLRRRSIK